MENTPKDKKSIGLVFVLPIVLGLVGLLGNFTLHSTKFNFNRLFSSSNVDKSFNQSLPNPNIHSPIYLIQLAKYEAYIFRLLSEFEIFSNTTADPAPWELIEKVEE
jgi:hypothetical protein